MHLSLFMSLVFQLLGKFLRKNTKGTVLKLAPVDALDTCLIHRKFSLITADIEETKVFFLLRILS